MKGVWDNGLKPTPPSRKGSKLSPEHIEALRRANKGNKHSLGKKDSEETKRLKSEKSARYWLGKKRSPHSAETRKKMSESHKGHPVSEATKDRMKNLTKGNFGRKHPRWTDEKKRPLYKAIRQLFKYVDWRSAIFARDNFTCVLCKTKGYIEADHHPIRFVDILRKNGIENIDSAIKCDELWDITNGRTLCKSCHLKTLTWGSKSRIKETVMQ